MKLRTLALLLAMPWVVSSTLADEPELTKEESARVRRLFREVQDDPEVKRTRQESREAVRRHQEALRKAMIERDPSIEPALAKMKDSVSGDLPIRHPGEETLRTLDLPLGRLSPEERRRWLAAMQKLQGRDLVKEFRQHVRQERQARDQSRRAHLARAAEFRGKMRQALLEVDPGLTDILDKLDREAKGRKGRPPRP